MGSRPADYGMASTPTIAEHTLESSETMASIRIESNAAPMDQRPPKLKGRQRLLHGLQRTLSASSLAKMGRSPSSTYRSSGLGTMSCISLSSSNSPYGHSYDSAYSSQSSAGFSTAPTSLASTPGVDMHFFHARSQNRVLEKGILQNGAATLASVPLPTELRFSSMGATLATTPHTPGGQDDYFSIPVPQAKTRVRRANFDFWGEMPHEIQVQIFQFLKPKQLVRCSAVSKNWRKMCFDGQLWINLDTFDFYKDIPSTSLVKVLTAAGPFLRDLNLRGCAQMAERWREDSGRITQACRNLENFSIEGCHIDRGSVHSFLHRNPRLIHINMSGMTVLNNTAMKIIADECPQLEYLNVSWCQHIDTKGLHRIVQSCPKLKDLRAGEVKGWDDQDFLVDIFSRNSLERLLVSHCTDLDDDGLRILMHGKDPEVDPLTDQPVVPPRKLRHLDISRCRALSSKGVKTLAYNVPALAGLQLSQCHSLTDEALEGILASSPLITHLDLEELDELTNTTLQNIAKAPCASRLEHLSISYCESLGDTGMLPLVKKCPSLKSLDMDNTRISDLVLTEVAAQVRKRNRAATVGNTSGKPEVGLRMDVYDCQNVNWTGVREILSRNAEFYRQPHDSTAPHYPREIISIKCFYGYQPTVEEHTKRVLRGDLARASMLERKWAEYMIATEEAGAQGAGNRRRRRRAREAAMVHADEEEGGARGGRRRARSGGCAVM